MKDIIPGYRIRMVRARVLLSVYLSAQPTAEELTGKNLSKEVLDLRRFESSLLHAYHRLVQLLTQLARKHVLKASRKAQDSTLNPTGLVAVRALCELLSKVPCSNLKSCSSRHTC